MTHIAEQPLTCIARFEIRRTNPRQTLFTAAVHQGQSVRIGLCDKDRIGEGKQP